MHGNVWCQKYCIIRPSSFLSLQSGHKIYLDSASLNSITLISALLNRVSHIYCFSNVFVQFYIFHSFHRRGTLCISVAEYLWTSGKMNFQIFFLFIVKGSFLYENLDDHHERSIHETNDLKNALQKITHTGKNDLSDILKGNIINNES